MALGAVTQGTTGIPLVGGAAQGIEPVQPVQPVVRRSAETMPQRPAQDPGSRPARAGNQSTLVQAQEEGSRAGESSGVKREQDLTQKEKEVVQELRQREREVERHEQAHQMAGGRYAGPANYQTARGPDGRVYKVGGEVPIDTSPADSPEETVDKMRQVIEAALAPAQPSAQDQRVAAQARQQLMEAKGEMNKQGRDGGDSGPGASQQPGASQGPERAADRAASAQAAADQQPSGKELADRAAEEPDRARRDTERAAVAAQAEDARQSGTAPRDDGPGVSAERARQASNAYQRAASLVRTVSQAA